MTDIPKPAVGDTSWDDWAQEQEEVTDLVRSLGVAPAPTGTASTDQAAVQAAIDAASAAGSGVVQLQPGDYAMDAELLLKNRVALLGAGIRRTRLVWSADLGTGKYAVRNADTGVGIQEDAPSLEGMTLQGPVNALLPGGTSALMDGWRVGRDVHGTRVKVKGFRAGAVIIGDHNTMTHCSFNDNYYNVLYHGTPPTKGNQYWIGCNFTGAGFASIAVDGTNAIDGCIFVGGHTGFAPYALYRFDAGGTGAMMTGCVLDGLSFEACGNGAIYDSCTTSSTSINNTSITLPGFSWSDDNSGGGWGRRIAGTPRDYSVVVRGFTRTFIRGGAAPFSDGAVATYDIVVGGSFVGLELEQNTVPKIAGIADNVRLDNGESRVFYKKANAAVTVNDLVEISGSNRVSPYGTNSRAFAGVALATVAINGYVPVAYEGRVTVGTSTTAIGTSGIPVTPVVGALTKVAPVGSTGSTGIAGADSTVIPSKYPIIGYSDTNIGASTTGRIWLTGTEHPNRQFVAPGAVTALPTASSTYRGQMLRVEGASGVADGLYVCMKDSANAYAWKAVTLT